MNSIPSDELAKKSESNKFKEKETKQRHWKLLRKFTEENLERGFTLEHASTYLLDKSDELKDVSISTLDQILNKQLGLSFKKLGDNHPTKANPENRNNLKTWILAISELVKMEFYVVYLDEFLININARRNTAGYWKVNLEECFQSSKSSGWVLLWHIAR